MVALLAEGVDRNTSSLKMKQCSGEVALLAEGVDRNIALEAECAGVTGRPPRGGRG